MKRSENTILPIGMRGFLNYQSVIQGFCLRIDLSDGARLTLETVDLENMTLIRSVRPPEVTLRLYCWVGISMDYPPVWLILVWKSENFAKIGTAVLPQ